MGNFDLTVSENLDLNLNIHIIRILQKLGKAKIFLEEYLSYSVMLKRVISDFFESLYYPEPFLRKFHGDSHSYCPFLLCTYIGVFWSICSLYLYSSMCLCDSRSQETL